MIEASKKEESGFSSVSLWAILLTFCLGFGVLTTTSMVQKSATFDEPNKLISGYANLKWGDYRLSPDHPPLARMLTALPLLALKTPDPRYTDHRWQESLSDETAHLLFTSTMLHRADADKVLFWARSMVVGLGMVLGLFIFLWATELYGKVAGLMAFFFYGLDPNILAHSQLATSDIALSLFMFLSVYAFYLTCQRFTLLTGLFCAISIACAVLTKHSGWSALIVVVLMGTVRVFTSTGWPVGFGNVRLLETKKEKLFLFLMFILGTGVLTYFMIWALYGFRYRAVPDSTSAELNLIQSSLSPSLVVYFFHWLKELRLFPEAYLEGVLLSLSRIQSGHHFFLLGQHSTEGWLHYFLVAFLVKTPVPTLLLLGISLGLAINKRLPLQKTELFLLVPAGAYFLIATLSRHNLGVRYILPIYPFLFVFMSRLVPCRQMIEHWKKRIAGVLIALWYLVSSQSIYPHYLAYFNELIGGPENGYRVLVDSNVDWGQDLKGLKRWMEDRRVNLVGLSYFGTADPTYYGIRFVYLPSIPFDYSGYEQKVTAMKPKYVAVSVTNLQGVFLDQKDRAVLAPFVAKEPIAKIGYSIFVYPYL